MDSSYWTRQEHLENVPADQVLRMHPAVRRILKVSLPALFLFLLYLQYSGAFDVLIYDKLLIWVAALVVLLILPAMVYWICRLWITADKYATLPAVLASCCVLINGPYYGYWAGRHETAIFRQYGIKTSAIVTRSFYNEGARMYYTFEAGGNFYESFNTTNSEGHSAGDTIEIIYDRRNPDLNSPVSLLPE